METKKILCATHSGSFHADDVVAYSVLKIALGDTMEFIRTRDLEVLKTADVVFDVGGIFDPETHRYDHHMRVKPLRDTGQPYSSAGLVWKNFGRQAIKAIYPEVTLAVLEDLWTSVDKGFMLPIDLTDNGVEFPGSLDFSVLIAGFNSTWDQPETDENFFEAAHFTAGVLKRNLARQIASLKARDQVRKCYYEGANPQVLDLGEQYMPYQKVVDEENWPVLYSVYLGSGQWRINTMPVERGSFQSRKPLPSAWGGLTTEELRRVSGVPDAMFCHPNLFTCGALSREGILAMLDLALKQEK